MNDVARTKSDIIDIVEQEMFKHEQVICPVKNLFTPGMYVRSLFVPKGTILTTEIHKTEHPFVLMAGTITVYNLETDETTTLTGPHLGVTLPGTRRVASAHTDCIWVTFHATELTDVNKIADEILEQRDNVTPQYKLNQILEIK